MVTRAIHDAYLGILQAELMPATGCTEPIAIAYAASLARTILGKNPEHLTLTCSANILKNVKSVTVPNSGGLKGVAAAAIAGVVGGDYRARLDVLKSLGDGEIPEIRRLLASGYCRTQLAEGRTGLYIEAVASAGGSSSRVVIEHSHTGVTLLEKDGSRIPAGLFGLDEYGDEPSVEDGTERASGLGSGAASGAGTLSATRGATIGDARDARGATQDITREAARAGLDPGSGNREAYNLLTVRNIVEFADTVPLAEVEDLMLEQVRVNTLIAREGLEHEYGVSVGRTLLKYRGTDVRIRARAMAAAGSDARMAGCAMPVIINSGSGNQGLTVSLPVAEYARELQSSREQLVRALVVSNLVSLEQQEFIGKLSAYCGAVSASVGSAAGIAWLKGADYNQIARTITVAIATAGGILCDGAKSSCAAKIATALEAAILAHEIGMGENTAFASGEGLVGSDVDQTIRNIGMVGSVGMRPTDLKVIEVMLDSQ